MIQKLFLRAVVREAFSILYRFNDHFAGKIFENIADHKFKRVSFSSKREVNLVVDAERGRLKFNDDIIINELSWILVFFYTSVNPAINNINAHRFSRFHSLQNDSRRGATFIDINIL